MAYKGWYAKKPKQTKPLIFTDIYIFKKAMKGFSQKFWLTGKSSGEKSISFCFMAR